ncbi:bifunctional hydroxymethylpyrimidine kinase/phosphomethylpyrimidine kinase [Vibrio algivorus]|uniref:hydroxymethylpyrimidine kinase n=1 Tax=Vibrio algivorus TaxID=1667024 RepID=A0A557NUR0_9VIBR|nr:bifunctional hydroxymethylpyrimidine kinase/phosphomethylpyrimidine kinase [Vibrio algivorus]TVO32160.1 bifunctional hydroxymethylpyrimidine kinase/phosphomethylpyrimidine kinase [Vibrio algivorus]
MSQSTFPSPHTSNIPNVLTIAGSDSGGGAGIQADIKAISATGSFACSAITALTAQNTQGVDAIFPVSAEFIGQQLDSICSDINVAAVKIGMLNDSDVIEVIAEKLTHYNLMNVVLDPVMVATSGDPLIQPAAINTLKEKLIPLVELITPNLPEAGLLIGEPEPKSESEIEGFIEKLKAHSELHKVDILLKGGHFRGEESRDWLIQRNQTAVYTHRRIATQNTHGTGCTLSSAIASYLAQGFDLTEAIGHAKQYLSNALTHADELNVGKGSGPVHHFYAQASK